MPLIVEPAFDKLMLGCGSTPSPGYTRVDANPAAPDLHWCGDAAGPLPFPDRSFAEIRAVDVLEHIPYRRTTAALTEWARVLRPGGRLYVQVPDCGRIMEEYIANPGRWRERLPADLQGLPPIIGVTWRIMGGQDDGVYADAETWRFNLHTAMFDEPSLHWFVAKAGMFVESCESNVHPNLCAWISK